MAVPKRRHSKARSRSRRTHQVEHVTSIAHCLQCKSPVTTHQVCGGCGFYKGIKILTTKAERAEKRGQVRQTKEARNSLARKDQVVSAE